VYAYDEQAPGGRELLGGKGVGLAEMTALGAPVPAGFTVTTDACREVMRTGDVPEGLWSEIDEHLGRLEQRTGKRFGDAGDPLLVSVRSGAAISMPGMMDTILNLGLNDEAVEGLASATGNPRFAYDSYRRLIQMYGEVVDGIDGHAFENELQALKERRGAELDVALTAHDLRGLVETFQQLYEREVGTPFPADASEQLRRAVRAVFDSWESPRAKVYRRTYDIPDDLGTAVNVVQMVFGNKGESSGTGVCFTRDPSTGERRLFGEFLVDAQGEDVVAGIRTPEPIERMRELLPDAYERLVEALDRLEEHYREMQDIEFTVEEGELFLLQTRTGKRTARSALRIAVEMTDEGLISREEAVARIDPGQLDQLLHPMIDPNAELDVVATGLNASPGAAAGAIVLDADLAEERGRAGEDVVLVRWETTPDDIHGLIHARGVLTAHGGMTSHAAVVARGMGKPCVAGCETLSIDTKARTIQLGDVQLAEGDQLTIDGGTGRVIVGAAPLVPPEIDERFGTILGWADELRRLRVRANADTPEDAAKAREFGAEGIGLCRTEHMFMAADRLPVVQEMILASEEPARRAALDRLLPVQQADFEGIFEAMAGFPVTIRLLDPPLHEFLPSAEEATSETMRRRIEQLREANPMLGTRGCRLGLQYPEIYEMQVRAIVRAAAAVHERTGEAPLVEIMHPLVAFGEELRRLRELTESVAGEEKATEHLIGTMIELPRACMRADEIAELADFFSFGTNDLTQTALGFSRDDAEGKFLTYYLEQGILERNPFEVLDTEGVGDLMRIAVERGRGAKPGIKLGICGEHGGEPHSVAFCHSLGLDYVSCSPYRVPLARLAAAQAALAETGVTAVAVGG
ncbi:pyruvate, phosphate dikinase, partial [Gaiella sp.]|uniref:pyruvate, phosphate dikinase n=1 Tax=Gaiella sp. TaxID=2663207 RepID=UPI002E342222